MDAQKHSYQPRVVRRSRRIALRDVDYHVSEWGEAGRPRLFFLHGWGDSGSTFQFVVDALSEDWHVIAPDWRGFGRSAHTGQSYWFPDYLADLHALLNEYEPDSPALLVGHSMGANVIGLYGGVMPDRVRGFVNLEGFGLADADPEEASPTYRRWIEGMEGPSAFASYASFDDLARRIMRRNPFATLERARFVAAEWASPAEGGGVELRADRRHRLPNPVLYRRAEARACWQRFIAPVLLVAGADSAYAASGSGLAEYAQMFAGSADSLCVPQAGHMLHIEAPAAIAAAIEGFAQHL